MENKLEDLDKKFIQQLNLAKENLNKAKQSDAFEDFEGFITPNMQYIDSIEYYREKYLSVLFDVENMEIYKESVNGLINFLQFHILQLMDLNNFFKEVKNRGDIK